jgi:hypothetical protein
VYTIKKNTKKPIECANNLYSAIGRKYITGFSILKQFFLLKNIKMWNAFVLSSYQKAFINKADSKRNLKPDYDLICKTGKIKIEHVQNFCEKMHKKVNGNLKFSLLKIKFRHLEIKTVMS